MIEKNELIPNDTSVSVIVRTKDNPKLLRDILKSIAEQSYPNIKLVILNYGEVDVASLVNEFKPNFVENIQYFFLKENQEQPAVENAGLEAAIGDYLINSEIINKKLKTAIKAKDKQIQYLQDSIDFIKSSISWKITNPLRIANIWFQKAKGLYRNCLHNISLIPHHQIVPTKDGKFRSTGDEPQFILASSKNELPTAWVIITGRIESDIPLCLELFFADKNGFSPEQTCMISVNKTGEIQELVRFPELVEALRLEPMNYEGIFRINQFQIREIGSSQALFKLLWPRLHQIIFHPSRMMTLFAKGWHVYRIKGWSGFRAALLDKIHIDKDIFYYKQWVKKYSTLTEADRKLISLRIEKLNYKPLISVIIPVYNTPAEILRSAIESVRGQLYSNWELCIADDASTLPHVRTILDEYQKNDQRIKLVFREENGHISAASNSAMALATGEFIALLDHDDELTPHALYMVAEELNSYSDADIIYSDEDKIDEEGNRIFPHFKSDWNPELFYSNNYVCHLFVCRTSLVKSTGGFRKGVEGSQDYDLILRCATKTKPERIRHIPHILYHWRAISGSTALDSSEKDYATEAGVKVLTDHFSKTEPSVKVQAAQLPTTYRVIYPILKPEPKISLIIPTRNSHKILKTCVESILAKTTYENYEIIIVNNQSSEKKSLDYLGYLNQQERIRVIDYDHPFNYSAINNFAVSETAGDLVGLVNNDIEVISPKWLEEMISHAIRPKVGAVGAKLIYPNNTIQHAGVIIGVGGVAEHSHKGFLSTHTGYSSRLTLLQAVSGVTGACLIIRRKIYEEVHGLDEDNLPVAFNDVDFCLRIADAGYRNVWTPYAVLYHHESISRGRDELREKRNRFVKEVEFMMSRWGSRLENDPYYNPNLNIDRGDFSFAWPSRAKKPWK